MSNLLAMPLVQMAVETGNNEDWIDSLLFVVDDGSGIPAGMPQLDLAGITFEMEVRRSASDAEVIIAASTADGGLMIGEPPNYGYLLFNISAVDMGRIRAGSYIADITGRDEEHIRVVVQITTLTVIDGITKKPVNKRVIVQAAAA